MNDKHLAELEDKWLRGTISDEEALEYAAWYNKDQDKPLQVPEHIAQSREEHLARMLEGMIDKIEAEGLSESTEGNLIPWYKQYQVWGIAASVFLVMGLFFLWQINYSSKKDSTELAQDKVAGTEGMVLTLDNGQQLEIDSLPDGLIADQNGLRIIKKEGALYYEGETNNIAYHTASTPKGRRFEIQLPDGSVAWLNAASSIKYPVKFDGKNRKVSINGEVYFEVKPDKTKPFLVETGDQVVQVLGTHFNVKRYAQEDQSTVTLLEGKVQVNSKGREVILNPNEQLVLNRKQNKLEKSTVNAQESTSWINGVFNFEGSNLEDVMNQIGRWYNIEVVFEEGVNKEQTFAGSTSMNQNLSEVLKVLKLAGIQTKIVNNQLVIYPYGK
ncbi:FecR family protein [Sphingobacterium lactis]|uniref:FecR family protein n=1 Tax=Sphingobacterium lactis TaxID=797291 RepID=UPI003F7E9346